MEEGVAERTEVESGRFHLQRSSAVRGSAARYQAVADEGVVERDGVKGLLDGSRGPRRSYAWSASEWVIYPLHELRKAFAAVLKLRWEVIGRNE